MRNDIINAQNSLNSNPPQPDVAIQLLRKYKNVQNPGSWVISYLLGIAYLQKEELKTAIKYFELARKRGGENLDVLHLLSDTYVKMSEFGKAESILAKIISQKEDHALAWKNLGLVYDSQDKYEEALRVLAKSNNFDSSDLKVASLAGEVYTKIGKLDEAWRAFDAILSVDNYSIDAHLGKARIHIVLEKYESALDCLKTVGQIDPNDRNYRRLLAEVYFIISEVDKSRQILEVLLDEGPKDHSTRVLLAKCLKEIDQYDEAEIALIKALNDGAEAVSTLPVYAEVVIRNSNHSSEKKNQLINKAVKKYPVNKLLTYVPEINPEVNRKLNIGFISNLFWDNPEGEKLLNIIRLLPKDQFNVFCFASNRKNDKVSRLIAESCEEFTFIFKSSPVEVRESVLKNQIDILCDCTSEYQVLISKVIQRKPSPVILKWAENTINPLEFNHIDYLFYTAVKEPIFGNSSSMKYIRMPEAADENISVSYSIALTKAFNQVWNRAVNGINSKDKRTEDIQIERATSEEIQEVIQSNKNEVIEEKPLNRLIPDSFWDGLMTSERAEHIVETTRKFFEDDFTEDLLSKIIEETRDRLVQYPTDNIAFFIQSRALQALPSENSFQNTSFSELDVHLKERTWWFKRAIYNYWFEKVEWKKQQTGSKVSAIVIANKFKDRSVENLKRLAEQLKGIGEVIFVNNGLEDAEFDSLMPYIDIYVKANGNSGAYLARNMGAVFARGEHLIFVDDDGIPDQGFIDAHLKEHAERNILVSRGVYYSSNVIDDPLHYNIGTNVKPAYTILEGNAMYNAEAFYKVGGWGDYILFGHGGKDLSYRLLELNPDKEQQIYVPGSRLHHEYFRGESHKSEKIEKQTASMNLLEALHPGLQETVDTWPIEFTSFPVKKDNSVSPALLKLPENKVSKFIHLCRNHVYSQSISDMIEELNQISNQQHWLLVEKSRWNVGGEGYSIDENKNANTLFFDCTSQSDMDGIIRELTHPEVTAVFFHGIFRQWEYYLLNAIGDKKHVGWIIWGGDLYKPIQRNQDRVFPHQKFSSVHTSVSGDIELFRKYYGDKKFFDFAYPYPALYGDITVPKPTLTKKIIVGNSGDSSNNHIEILNQLSRKKDVSDYQLILPVAYNFNQNYKDEVIAAISELGLSENVILHDKFLAPEEYRDLISQVDMMIMAHDRQQAMGNSLMGLYFNKPVFLKKNISLKDEKFINPGWKFLADHDLCPFQFEDFDKFDSLAEISELVNQSSSKNQEAIEHHFGLTTRARILGNNCEQLFNEIQDSENPEKVETKLMKAVF